jgi:hypothetical protein
VRAVRFYKTHPIDELAADLRSFAQRLLGNHLEPPGMSCLVLLASAGLLPQWGSRFSSVGHQAIPLASEAMLERFPMVSQLIVQLGVPVRALVNRDSRLLLELEERTYNVFYVPEARGSAERGTP